MILIRRALLTLLLLTALTNAIVRELNRPE